MLHHTSVILLWQDSVASHAYSMDREGDKLIEVIWLLVSILSKMMAVVTYHRLKDLIVSIRPMYGKAGFFTKSHATNVLMQTLRIGVWLKSRIGSHGGNGVAVRVSTHARNNVFASFIVNKCGKNIFKSVLPPMLSIEAPELPVT